MAVGLPLLETGTNRLEELNSKMKKRRYIDGNIERLFGRCIGVSRP